jgi:hypothetical protein
MFIFLNLTLHSFGPENFVPLVLIRQYQKGLIEESESYKMVITLSQSANFCWGKSRLRQKPHVLMHQPNIFEGFITCLYIVILSCTLMTKHDIYLDFLRLLLDQLPY